MRLRRQFAGPAREVHALPLLCAAWEHYCWYVEYHMEEDGGLEGDLLTV